MVSRLSLFYQIVLLIGFILVLLAGYPKGTNFFCRSINDCVEEGKICNGVNDCADGSEEVDYPEVCICNGTVWTPNSTAQSSKWWYTCSRSNWHLSGCVVHGDNEEFGTANWIFSNCGDFSGLCGQVDPSIFLHQPRACKGRVYRATNGDAFFLTELFWAKCIISQNRTIINGTHITLNTASWQINGCHDRTEKIVGENIEFSWIFQPAPIWGIKLRCHIPSEPNRIPSLEPLACTIALNKTNKLEIRRLDNKCYTAEGDWLYYCTIIENKTASELAGHQSADSLENDFELSMTKNNVKTLRNLALKGYKQCYGTDDQTSDLINRKWPRNEQF